MLLASFLTSCLAVSVQPCMGGSQLKKISMTNSTLTLVKPLKIEFRLMILEVCLTDFPLDNA